MPIVAQVIAQTLAAYDTRYYFCVTGGDHDLWLALDEAGIDIVNCRSESAAAYMADGYARVSGRPGFVYGQRGPGVANVAAALADPLWGKSPVVSLTTSIARPTRDRFQYQEIDTLPMHEPVTIWNRAVWDPQRAADMVRAAIRAATSFVPGPVHLEIPADMLAVELGDGPVYADQSAAAVAARRLTPRWDDVTAVVEELSQAQRPIIVAGKGAIISGAWAEVEALSEALGIPVTTTLGGKGAIDESRRLAVGTIGRYSRRVANEVLRDADTILAIGTRLGGLATHGWTLPFADKRLVHIDTDPLVIGHNFRTEFGVVGDAKLTLAAAVEEILSRQTDGRLRTGSTAWSDEVARRVDRWRSAARSLEKETPEDGMHPAAVIAALRRAMGPDDLLAADTGAIAAWAGTLFDVSAGQNMIRSAGSLGWVLPAAMGACLAAPHRRTVALTGDGGLLYHIGELETAVRREIPLVVIVINNRAFGSEGHLLKNIWKRELPKVVDFHDCDFATIARGFGAYGITVDDPAALDEAIAEAFAQDGPVLVDVRVSKDTQAPAENFRGESFV